ncbi:peptide ABC transporter substrate-binding protein [Denitrobaculum tricleocarpae]|uniref:Peptide ABC transporter substrate-binding protein n=1 Tax=Denitrobaculum tricleocarpae TaxID=2591009 RepID=A0A545TXT1_9PROT|nr:peptide ABC transporter substrate-binding protein [Denitrobaculum tricleocarpae]TQV82029.1 peptide ABC transporter substrate-binding protein [Denitrobaculum tricleocarpae]
MRRLLSAIGALFLGLATPSALAAETLTIGITQYPSSFHPTLVSMLAQRYVEGLTLRPITVYDHDWKLVCMLCTELPTIENGGARRETYEKDGETKEGMAVTYSLHPDATWGDGTPVSSDDMLFTWEMGRDERSGAVSLEAFQRILSIDIIDEKTFTLHLDRVTYSYNAFSLALLPAHIERPIFEANPAEYRNRTAFDRDPFNPGLAFGPYRLAAAEPGSAMEFLPNPTWWGPKPAFDKIIVRAIENTAALEANLLSGAVDTIAGEIGLTLDQALAFEKRNGDKFDMVYKSGLIYEHIDLNLDNPILADQRVRKALIHALDRETISAQLFQGRQPVAHASVSPLDSVHNPETPTYPYDPAKAKALLDEAGWSVMKRGIRHNADGEPLTIEIMTTAGNRSRELVQQVLQSQWRQIGIDITVRNQPARVFFGETVSRRKFTGMAMFAWISSPESVPLTTLSSTQIPTEANGWSGQNYTGFNNAEMDALIDGIERELDFEKRKKLWARLQTLYAEELPVIPLYWRANAFPLPKWLKGVRPTGHQLTTTLWVEEWRVEGRN